MAVGTLISGPTPKLMAGLPTSIRYAAKALKSPRPVSWSVPGSTGLVITGSEARISHFDSPIEKGCA